MFQFRKHAVGPLLQARCSCATDLAGLQVPTEMQAVVTMGGWTLGARPGVSELSFSAQSPGTPGDAHHTDTLADAVDICAKLGRVLQTVHLSGLLGWHYDAGSSSCGRKDAE